MKRLSFAVMICVLLLSSISFAKDMQVRVGNKILTMPQFGDYHLVSEDGSALNRFLSVSLPADTRFLAGYADPHDRERTEQGDTPLLERFFQLIIVKDYERAEWPRKKFISMRDSAVKEGPGLDAMGREEINKTAELGVNRVLKKVGMAAEVRVTGMTPLGFFGMTDNAYSEAVLVNLTTTVDGETTKAYIVGSLTLMNVNGKLLFMNGYRSYTGYEDIEVLRSETVALTEKILKVNE